MNEMSKNANLLSAPPNKYPVNESGLISLVEYKSREKEEEMYRNI